MTPGEVEDLMEYLGEHPPLHLMVQAFLGIEGKTGTLEAAQEPTDAEAAAFFRMVNGG